MMMMHRTSRMEITAMVKAFGEELFGLGSYCSLFRKFPVELVGEDEFVGEVEFVGDVEFDGEVEFIGGVELVEFLEF